MTEQVPFAVVTDDAPRAASLTAAQSTIAIAERDMTLLVTSVATVLKGYDAPVLTEEDRRRLRKLNAVLFHELSDVGRQEVRNRTTAACADTLQRSA